MGDRAASGGRYGYWFPLVLLGFGLLGLLGWDSVRASQDFGWFSYTPMSSDPVHLDTAILSPGADYQARAVSFNLTQYPMRDWPWAVLVTTTLVATVAWYGWRARRADGSVRGHVALAVGCGILVPAGHVVVGMADTTADPAKLVTSVGLPLIGLGVLAAAWACFRLGPGRRAAALISAACLVVGVGTVLGAWSPGLLDPVIIAGGLLTLARFERSLLLAVVAVAVLVAMVVFPVGMLSTLIPAVMMLAAAIVALVRQSGPPQPV